MMNSLVLMNGQWQGGADIVTLDGAKEIENCERKMQTMYSQ